MPLDPSIITRVQPPQVTSPLETLQTLAQMQDIRAQAEQRRLAGEAARQKAMDDAAIRNAMTAAGGDVDKAMPQIMAVNPRAGASLQEAIGKARNEQLTAMKTGLENQGKQLDLNLKVWGNVTDQSSLDTIRPMLVKTSPQLDAILPTTYDPDAVQRVSDMALSRKDQLEQKQKIVDLFANGKINEAVGGALSLAKSAEEWNGYLKGAKALGAPDAILAPYGDYSPENVARAAQLAITPAKREELAGQAATRAQTAAHQTTQEAIARGQLDVSRGQLGVAQAREAREAAKPAGSGTRPVTSGDANKIADLNTSRTDLATLATTISSSGATGLGAQVGAALPPWITDVTGWGTDAKKKQALIDMVKQVIGKTLEGGVLRKEDEVKYEKILPTIKDTNEVVLSKLQGVDQALIDKRQSHLDALADAGYDISRFAARPTSPPLGQTKTGPAGRQVGDVVTLKDGRRVKITTVLPNGKFEGTPVP